MIDDTESKRRPAQPSAADRRAERLAAALRVNLQRRKAQTRGRRTASLDAPEPRADADVDPSGDGTPAGSDDPSRPDSA